LGFCQGRSRRKSRDNVQRFCGLDGQSGPLWLKTKTNVNLSTRLTQSDDKGQQFSTLRGLENVGLLILNVPKAAAARRGDNSLQSFYILTTSFKSLRIQNSA